jgi:hypothetical protein
MLRVSGRAIVLGLLCCAVSTAALGAPIIHEPRALAGFKAIRLTGAIDMFITQGTTDSVTIEGEADQVKEVTATVDKDGTLVIAHPTGWSLWSWFRVPAQAPRAVVTVKTLNGIELEGSGDVHAGTLVCQDQFLARITGSGDIHIDALAARALDARIAGSGDIRIGGAVSDATVRIAGSGDFAGGELKSISAKVSIAGSGDATVWARDRLEVTISGRGDVSYFGTPVIVQSIAGSGSLKPLGMKN